MYVVINKPNNKMYVASTTTVVNLIVKVSRNTLYKHFRKYPETGYIVKDYVIFKAQKIELEEPVTL